MRKSGISAKMTAMLKIKLSRTGKKNYACYKIVVKERRSKRDGQYLEVIGIYNPSTRPQTVTIDRKKLTYWLSRGAQPTATVNRLIKTHA